MPEKAPAAPPLLTPVTDEVIQNAVQAALIEHQNAQGNLLPILHAIQDALGYIPSTCVPVLALALNRSRAEIHGVITFYAYFRQTPPAALKLEICRAEACQAMGGDALAHHAIQTLGCDFKGTSRDERVDLEPVYCLGLCAQSPAVALNGQPHARMTPDKLDRLLGKTSSDSVAKAQS